MKKYFLLFAISAPLFAIAQRNGIFAVTDFKQGGSQWNTIRQVNIADGSERMLISNRELNVNKVEATSKLKSEVAQQNGKEIQEHPLHSGVAALAYDRVHNRLYYSTMFSGQLRYIEVEKNPSNQYFDLGNIYETLPRANNTPVSSNNQGPVITRMVIGSDGYGYGLSNDGESFFRFNTTGRKTTIQNIGKLVDDPANEGMSVHASCSSWGGDMVASADGDLYLFSMYQHVFKINTSSRVATYLGKVEGLPGGFTINGAAVAEDGSVTLSSAAIPALIANVKEDNLLKASTQQQNNWFNTSDLASGFRLYEKKTKAEFASFDKPESKVFVDVYPNPVVTGELTVWFKEGHMGRYSLDLLDNAGGSKLQSNVVMDGGAQRVTMRTSKLAKGLYLLRVLNAEKQEVQTVKVMIQ